MLPIYLDYNATTPVDPQVLEAMLPYFTTQFGNPASNTHPFGWEAQKIIKECRGKIADFIGGEGPESIIFTAGTTESNNLVIKGLVEMSSHNPPHIITQKTEHGSVLQPCEHVESAKGCEVTYLDVDENGLVRPEDLRAAIKENTILVTIMAANNEIGTVQNLKELAAVAHEKPGVLFHTDAAQAAGKVSMHVQNDGIDLMSFTSHKIYGPKGVGSLYVAQKNPPIGLAPCVHGGGHEKGLRSGTLNVPGIVGLTKALEVCVGEMKTESEREIKFRDYILKELNEKLGHITLNGHPTQRLPNNTNIAIKFIDASDLIAALPGYAFSTSSACSSESTKPSHVLMAIADDEGRAKSSMRISVGRSTTEDEVKKAVHDIIDAVKKLRSKSLEYEMSQRNT